MTTRFENGIVITLGEENRVLWNATVVTDGELVAAVGNSAEMKLRFPEAEAIDCSGQVVLPGFICAHHHFYSTMARGMSIPGEPAANFVQILERLWWKVDRSLTEEDILLSAQMPLIDCIRNGTTTVIDHHASPSMRDGSLDYSLLQPVDSMFMVTFSRMTIWRAWDLLLGAGLIVDLPQAHVRVVPGRGDDAAVPERGEPVPVLADDTPAGARRAGVEAEDDHPRRARAPAWGDVRVLGSSAFVETLRRTTEGGEGS